MTRIRMTFALLAVAALAVAATGPFASAGTEPERATVAAEQNIVETAIAAGKFETLTKLVKKAGLADTLANDGPFTVFAPTDKAFSRVPKRTLRALGKDREKLRAVLLYHVVGRELPAAKLVKRRSVKTLNGKSLRIRTSAKKVKVNRATVVGADVQASNGVIHVINKVLIPR